MFFKYGIQALSNDQIMRQAPAVFAAQPHSRTSDEYLFVDTAKMVNGLRSEGWSCVSAVQTMNKATSKENRETNKHALFFARTETLGTSSLANVGDTIPLIKLENGHNGLTSFGLSTGYFRKACANGLTVPETIYAAPKVRHTKNMYNEVIEATYKVLNDFPQLMAMKQALQSLQLTNDERYLLGDTAADIFFTKEERLALNEKAKRWGNERYLLEMQLINAQRRDDRSSDLWTVSNVIQENLIRGNIQTVADTGRLNYKRKVTSIDRDKEIHEKLFMLTQKFAELKGLKIGKAA
jgi:hypothetical protein